VLGLYFIFKSSQKDIFVNYHVYMVVERLLLK